MALEHMHAMPPLPDCLAADYDRLDPADPDAWRDTSVAISAPVVQWLWQAGSYRCGIGAYLGFFLMGAQLTLANQANPRRFARLLALGLSFDITDNFIKAVTASGRQPSKGLADPGIRKRLARLGARHHQIGIPDWMMVHFGFLLVEQIEADLGIEDPCVLAAHLRYFAAVYRVMGIPFSADRELMYRYCRTLEEHQAQYTPAAGPAGRRLLFLGACVGVRPEPAWLAQTLPLRLRELALQHQDSLRPRLGWRLAGRLLNVLLWPRRRWRNPPPHGPLASCLSGD